MVTCSSNIDGGKKPHTFFGLSTDQKPTGMYNDIKIVNGSVYIAIDTKDIYLYDEQNEAWYLQ